jgi:serine/threonine protein kinase
MSADGESWSRMWDVFHGALERAPGQRKAYLSDACGQNAALRDRVEALLASHERAESFLEPPSSDDALVPTAEQVPDDSTEGKRIGRYTVRRTIGTGGMGVVYEAAQDHPHRLVALKVMRHGVASPSALGRFRHEAEILGRLQHPHIAQVHDAGTFDEGQGVQPYFAMELIRGRPLLEYADEKELGTRQRLELLVKVCDAVQYAHHKGVIHRDLKPDNILVDDFGEPKILDFGVARATGSDIQVTTLGRLLPRGRGLRADVRAPAA